MVNKKVGEKIRQLRVVAGLSQENIAEEIGMSHGNYGKIERGEIDVSSSHLIQIAKVLKANVGEFFEERAKANIKETKTDYGYATKAELAEVTHALHTLTQAIEKLQEELPKKKITVKRSTAKTKHK